MRKLLFTLATLLVAVCAQAQTSVRHTQSGGARYSVRGTTNGAVDSVALAHAVYDAGRYLKKSADFDYMAIGAAATGGILTAIGVSKKEIKDARPFYWAAVGCGVAALALKLTAIEYKSRSGKVLIFAPTGVKYKF